MKDEKIILPENLNTKKCCQEILKEFHKMFGENVSYSETSDPNIKQTSRTEAALYFLSIGQPLEALDIVTGKAFCIDVAIHIIDEDVCSGRKPFDKIGFRNSIRDYEAGSALTKLIVSELGRHGADIPERYGCAYGTSSLQFKANLEEILGPRHFDVNKILDHVHDEESEMMRETEARLRHRLMN